jgi:hypothetical protein
LAGEGHSRNEAISYWGAMAAPADWTDLFKAGIEARPQPILAETYLRSWGSASHPVLLECSNGHAYVVKGRQAGRMIVNDQIVAALGQMMGAPVPVPELINVPAELIAAQAEMSHVAAGTAHGSRFIPNCADREDVKHAGPENNGRFARLAVMYGWMQAGDNQFIYDNSVPPTVHSVDHGHFFPGGPDWTEASLQGAGPAQLEPTLDSTVTWTDELLTEIVASLTQIDDGMIARAVCRPPDDWGMAPSERSALATYLSSRRDVLTQLLEGKKTGA